MARPGVRRACAETRRLLSAPALAALLVASAGAQVVPREPERAEIEAFASVDPYTEGDAAALEALGYRSLGGFELIDGFRTDEVDRALGGEPVLWVETAHFKLGSSLRTYSRSPDADERARLADELELLEPRLPGKRPRRSDLDPWLRLHLYALRLEALHAAFMERLGLSDADCVPLETDTWAQVWEKPVVLLTERTSTLGRFTETFLGRSCSSSYRGILENGGSFYGISAQSLREDDLPLDLALHVFVAEAVTLCLVDSFRRNLGSVPLWFKYGLGHVLARDIDPRWPRFEGHSERRESLSNAWKWEPRVEGMLRKGSAPSFEAMLAWEDPLRMTRVEHLFAWSRSEWLLQREGAARSFLIEVVHEARSSPGAPPQPAQVERQRALIEDAWGAELGELDRQWSEYVKKSY